MQYDIAIVKFEKFEEFDLKRRLTRSERIDLPEKIKFLGNFNVVNSDSDFPVAGGYLVMSEKMTKTLLSVKSFQYAEYPITIFDDTLLGERYINKGELHPDLKTLLNFSIIQPLEVFKGLDYKNSEYMPMRANQIYPTVITKMVLKEPSSGFPPLFRIEEKKSLLFVSQEAKTALVNNNIKGCRFKPVQFTAFNPTT